MDQRITRKYRSLGTTPRLTFQARLLHNQEDANAEKGGFRKISSRAFFRRIGRCLHPLGCGAIEPGKSVYGVCQDSDIYGMIANPARCQQNRGKGIFPFPFGIWSRETGRSRPATVCSFSTLRLNPVPIHGVPPTFRNGVHLLYRQPPSGHAIAYRWCSLPRVRRHRACSFKVVPVLDAAF